MQSSVQQWLHNKIRWCVHGLNKGADTLSDSAHKSCRSINSKLISRFVLYTRGENGLIRRVRIQVHVLLRWKPRLDPGIHRYWNA